MLSSMDDYPLHQIAEPIRNVGTSDRNFYDRYYFNLHGCSDELMLIMGMGQYPNLGVQDAFAVVRRGDKHLVVRASRELDDRMDTSVGPHRVEVIEPLHKVRWITESNEHGIACDVTWEGAIPAFLEPRQYIRKYGRVLFDTMRFAQTGLLDRDARGRRRALRHHARPLVGHPGPLVGRAPGGREGGARHPRRRGADGRHVELRADAVLRTSRSSTSSTSRTTASARPRRPSASGPTRPASPSGWADPEFDHTLVPGTRTVSSSVLSFPEAPGGGFDVKVTPLTHVYITVGTGYGMEEDWGHGMYQGPLVVQGVEHDMDELEKWAWYGVTDHVARFETGDTTGYGLHEHGFFGPFRKYGLERGDDTAP